MRASSRLGGLWLTLLCLSLTVTCSAPPETEPPSSADMRSSQGDAPQDLGVVDRGLGGTTAENNAGVDGIDGGDTPPQSDRLIIGRGVEEFIMMTEGEVSTLHRGCQGAQHLWVSLRIKDAEPNSYPFTLTLINEEGDEVAPPYTLDQEFWSPSVDDEGSELYGLTLVIFDPTRVVGQRALITAMVEIDGQRLSRSIWVEVQWGADAC